MHLNNLNGQACQAVWLAVQEVQVPGSYLRERLEKYPLQAAV